MGKVAKKLHVFLFLFFSYQLFVLYEGYTSEQESIITEIPNLKNQISSNKKKKRQLQKYFKDIEGTKKRIEKVAIEVESLQKKFPEKLSDTENLGLLRDIAESINIKDVFLSPSGETLKGFYYSRGYSLKATGTFLQFLVFLEKVAKSERILNIRKINFVNSDQKQKGRFQLLNAEISIESYRHNPKFRENRGYDDIENEFKKEKKKKKSKRRKKKA
ncbi:MAG: type 4a pilus biogenesis protein PilO [Bacteriovoracaceae bacterium]